MSYGREMFTVDIDNVLVDIVSENERIVERAKNASHEDYVLDRIAEVSHSSDVLWDVGACLGIHSLVGAAHYDKVVAFEPMAANRHLLMDHVGLNRQAYPERNQDIFVVADALSDTYGEAAFDIRQSDEPGYGRHGFHAGNYEAVKTTTVRKAPGDSMTDLGFPNVVKIDVEGAEGLVIDGMKETLSDPRCRHVILETHEPNDVQPSPEDYNYSTWGILSRLESYGFQLERMENDYHIHGYKQ